MAGDAGAPGVEVGAPDERTEEGTDERTDADLLRAHVAGDHEAFGRLFARHRDRLWAVALRTTGNPDDAADGLQDGLIAAYRRAGSYRGEAQVTTWMHRVVVNACLDRIRAARVRRAEPLPDDLEEYRSSGASLRAAGPGSAGPDGTDDPADLSVRGERRAAVLAALAELAPEQRAAVVLVDLEGYPVAEVALMLDCAPGTVKSRCSRGRARLAVALAPLLDDDRAASHSEDGNPPTPGGVPSGNTPRGPPAAP